MSIFVFALKVKIYDQPVQIYFNLSSGIISRNLSMLIMKYIIFHHRSGMGHKVDISELTWEQRERVLRLLFAKMNGSRVRPKPIENLAPAMNQKRPTLTMEPR